MTENKWCVYKHTTPSGKVYIGITSQKPERRWRNGDGYKSNPYFYHAIQKYGWDNIEHEILFDKLKEDDAKSKEIELIEKYDSYNRNKGYNLTLGGEGTTGHKWTEEERKEISKRFKDWYANNSLSEKQLANIHSSPNPESLKKRSETISRRVNQYDKDGNYIKTWLNCREAAEYYDCHYGVIHKVCNREFGCKTCMDFQWRYSDDCDDIEEYKNEHIKPVYMIDIESKNIIKKFNSIIEASNETQIRAGDISSTCRRNQKTAGGFIWTFLDDYEKCFYVDYNIGVRVNQYDKLGKYIQTFDSITDAIKVLGVKNGSPISQVCRKRKRTAYGFQWRYTDEFDMGVNIYKVQENRGKNSCKSVMQFDINGKYINTYESIVEAEKITRANASAITMCCNSKRKTAGGYKWEYAN